MIRGEASSSEFRFAHLPGAPQMRGSGRTLCLSSAGRALATTFFDATPMATYKYTHLKKKKMHWAYD